MIVAVTGHRPGKVGGYVLYNTTQLMVIAKLHAVLDALQPAKVITGMALGVDQWMAEVCVDRRLPFLAAIPFPGQESQWPPESQERYRDLLQKACEVVCVSNSPYHPGLLQVRNEWMVDRADRVVAVWDGSAGGTANCVRYAQKVGKTVHFLAPT